MLLNQFFQLFHVSTWNNIRIIFTKRANAKFLVILSCLQIIDKEKMGVNFVTVEAFLCAYQSAYIPHNKSVITTFELFRKSYIVTIEILTSVSCSETNSENCAILLIIHTGNNPTRWESDSQIIYLHMTNFCFLK